MEKLLTLIGELIATEMEEVEEINYINAESGDKFYVTTKDGRKFLLNLSDSNDIVRIEKHSNSTQDK